MRSLPRLAATLPFVAALACSKPAAPGCRIGVEHVVARSVANDFDAIALAATRKGPVALWSEARGLFARALSRQAEPRGRELRIGPACDGGFAALGGDDDITVACLYRARSGKEADPGGVLLLRLDPQLALRQSDRFGVAGSISEGIELARAADRLAVVWHDGSPDMHRIFWAELPLHGPAGEVTPRVISRRMRLAAAPSLVLEPRVAAVWAERWVEPGETLRSEVVYWDGHAAPRTLLADAHLNAMPKLVALGDRLLLAYRDQPSKYRKTGLYLRPVSARGRLLGEAVRAGRADGIGRPDLRACMGGLLTATPRTYGGDYFVGINWLDESLSSPRGEQQFYEDVHAFTRAAAVCLGDSALILIAELGQLERPETALRAVSYRCRESGE